MAFSLFLACLGLQAQSGAPPADGQRPARGPPEEDCDSEDEQWAAPPPPLRELRVASESLRSEAVRAPASWEAALELVGALGSPLKRAGHRAQGPAPSPRDEARGAFAEGARRLRAALPPEELARREAEAREERAAHRRQLLAIRRRVRVGSPPAPGPRPPCAAETTHRAPSPSLRPLFGVRGDSRVPLRAALHAALGDARPECQSRASSSSSGWEGAAPASSSAAAATVQAPVPAPQQLCQPPVIHLHATSTAKQEIWEGGAVPATPSFDAIVAPAAQQAAKQHPRQDGAGAVPSPAPPDGARAAAAGGAQAPAADSSSSGACNSETALLQQEASDAAWLGPAAAAPRPERAAHRGSGGGALAWAMQLPLPTVLGSARQRHQQLHQQQPRRRAGGAAAGGAALLGGWPEGPGAALELAAEDVKPRVHKPVAVGGGCAPGRRSTTENHPGELGNLLLAAPLVLARARPAGRAER
eukprot:scaffold1.g5731.t1